MSHITPSLTNWWRAILVQLAVFHQTPTADEILRIIEHCFHVYDMNEHFLYSGCHIDQHKNIMYSSRGDVGDPYDLRFNAWGNKPWRFLFYTDTIRTVRYKGIHQTRLWCLGPCASDEEGIANPACTSVINIKIPWTVGFICIL
jgi:hypothetical protein